MGLQDRDYWKERYDQNMGIRSQPQHKKDSSQLRKMRFFSTGEKRSSRWHWSLQLVLFVWLCIGIFAALRLINHLV